MGDDNRLYRLEHGKPVTGVFLHWMEREPYAETPKAKAPLTEALARTHQRRAAPELLLRDPDLPLDTIHLVRGLRVIPIGRKDWIFWWTEPGAEHVGIMHSPTVTRRWRGIDPYTAWVDVPQRVGVQPACWVLPGG